MVTMAELLLCLERNAQAIRVLVGSTTAEQAGWKPDADTWSLLEVLGHLYNEERGDFRQHLRELWSTPPLAWGALDAPWLPVADLPQALEGFLAERAESLEWLRTLPAPDWLVTVRMTFGPQQTPMVLSAGDLLVSWVEHDYLHIRQVNELLHAWHVRQAAPYSVSYAGGW
jgi:hypothetical protein